MKKTILSILLALCLLLPLFPALAEGLQTDAALAVMLAAHPGCTAAALAQFGNTAAALLTGTDEKRLCVAERQGDGWALTIDNPTALRPGDALPILELTADALSWCYADGTARTVYSATKAQGAWGNVALQVQTEDGYGLHSYTLSLEEGARLCKREQGLDAQGALLWERAYIPLPAAWLAPTTTLAAFDAAQFSSRTWTDADTLRHAAAALLPEDTFLGGALDNDSFTLFVEKPDGAQVLVGVTWNGNDWVQTESLPLPEGTVFGWDCFTSSLRLPNGLLVSVRAFADGTWGLNRVTRGAFEAVTFGQGWLAVEGPEGTTYALGDHPWGDLTALDWATLPDGGDAALARLDASGWAVLAETAPLSVRPDEAPSATYFAGTPVRVLAKQAGMVQVDVFGAQGWVQGEKLAFGADRAAVQSAQPFLCMKDQAVQLFSPADGQTVQATVYPSDAGLDLRVLGESSDGYQVWYAWSGLSGFVRQEDMRPGDE